MKTFDYRWSFLFYRFSKSLFSPARDVRDASLRSARHAQELFSRHRAPDDVQRGKASHLVNDGRFFGEVYIALQRAIIACV